MKWFLVAVAGAIVAVSGLNMFEHYDKFQSPMGSFGLGITLIGICAICLGAFKQVS